MTKANNKIKKGFTIIEVVLVLAIAGLIFLMVFIALPALQSAQRNTQRDEDLQRFVSAVTDYSGNNSGRLPFTISDGGEGELDENFVRRYIDDTCSSDVDFLAEVGEGGGNPIEEDACTADQFRDPDGNIYHFEVINGTTFDGDEGDVDGLAESFEEAQHAIYAVVGVMCGPNEGTYIKGTGTRQVALYMIMEGGAISCMANN